MNQDHDRLDRWSARAASIALGVAFLSAVASRFGLWQGHPNLGRFSEFIEYTGEVNAFLPKATYPYLAWMATIAESSFGVSLLLGLRPRVVSIGSAILLALFGTAMAISQGIKSPLDYSVYSAAGAALMLWRYHSRTDPAREARSH